MTALLAGEGWSPLYSWDGVIVDTEGPSQGAARAPLVFFHGLTCVKPPLETASGLRVPEETHIVCLLFCSNIAGPSDLGSQSPKSPVLRSSTE